MKIISLILLLGCAAYKPIGNRTASEIGLVGDGVTDNTELFYKYIDLNTLTLDSGVYLIGGGEMFQNLTLRFENGSRLRFKTGDEFGINAVIDAPNKHIFEHQDPLHPSRVLITNNEYISPMWFGGRMGGRSDDTLSNFYALRDAWNAAQLCNIKFPSGYYLMSSFEVGKRGVLATKNVSVYGSGYMKTTIKLAANQNSYLWCLTSSNDFEIKDIRLDGNQSQNQDNKYPVLRINGYRVQIEDVRIDNGYDGLKITKYHPNAIRLTNLVVVGMVNAGIVCNGVNSVYIDNPDIEQCAYGVIIENTYPGKRSSSNVTITGTPYFEQIDSVGIWLDGIHGFFMDVTGNLMTCGKYTFQLTTAHDNTIIIRSNYDPVTVFEDEKCYNNLIQLPK